MKAVETFKKIPGLILNALSYAGPYDRQARSDWSAPRKLFFFLFFRLPKAGLVYIALFTALGYLGRFHRYFELTSHFRVQYLAISALFFLIFLAWRSPRYVIVALVCVAANLAQVAPLHLAAVSGQPAGGGSRLKIVYSNVLTRNHRYQDLVRLIRGENPDVVIALEVNQSWVDSLDQIRDAWPYAVIRPHDDNFGIALYSRLPLVDSGVVALLDEALPSILGKVEIGGKKVSIFTTHTLPGVAGGESYRIRNEQLAETAKYMRRLPEPRILIGDMNVSLWSPYFSDLVKGAGLRNAREGFGVIPTWPVIFDHRLTMIPIDHCLVSPSIEVRGIRTGSDIGSDHLPMVIDLVIH